MYQKNDIIKNTHFNGLKVDRVVSKVGCETLLICLEKGHHFPEHTSPRDALLVMLEGDINFSINHTAYQLQTHQTFQFPAKEKHKVFANRNSKFLIIR
jgi:quercetin dioxygenase-like cupin family protein